MVLLHDNTRSYVSRLSRVKWAKFKWEHLDYPPYSSNMSPCDFRVFSPVKKIWKASTLTWTMNLRTLWRTRYDSWNSGSTESFSLIINGIVVLRCMVHTLNKVFIYTSSVVSYLFIWKHLVWIAVEQIFHCI